MVKNPTKLLNLVKTIGNKIDERLNQVNLKKVNLCVKQLNMNKMKNMPGMGDMESMIKWQVQ